MSPLDRECLAWRAETAAEMVRATIRTAFAQLEHELAACALSAVEAKTARAAIYEASLRAEAQVDGVLRDPARVWRRASVMSAYLDRPTRTEAEYRAAVRYRLKSAATDLWRHGLLSTDQRAEIIAAIDAEGHDANHG